MNLLRISALALLAQASMVAFADAGTLEVGDFSNPSASALYSGIGGDNAPALLSAAESASQFLYTPDELSAISGKVIQSVSFKYQSSAAALPVSLRVYVEETTATAYYTTSLPESGDVYYWERVDEGYEDYSFTATVAGSGVLTVDMSSKPFHYLGGSLRITVIASTASPDASVVFYGQQAGGSAVKGLTYFGSADFFSALAANGNTMIFQESTGATLTRTPVAQIAYTDYEAAEAFSGGSGTAADPYLISTVADFSQLNEWTNSGAARGVYFRLINDLTLTRNVCVGTVGDFNGTFDGGGHCVTVDIDYPTSNYSGLFLSTADGTVRNLQVAGTVKGGTYTGGVVGAAAEGSLIESVANFASVDGTYYVGGIVGAMVSASGSGSAVRQCANFGNVSGYLAGGIAGYSGQRVGNELRRLANYGNIDTEGSRSAGIVGNPLYYDKLYAFANFGTTSNHAIAGTVGNPVTSTIAYLFYDSQTFYTTATNAYQARYTNQLVGDGLKSTGDFSDSYWLYADGMLPRLLMDGIERTDRVTLYATPVTLDTRDNVTDVSHPFTVGVGNGVSWTAANGNVSIAADGSVEILHVGEERLTASLGGFSRTVEINITGGAGVKDAAGAAEASVVGGKGEIRVAVGADAQIAVCGVSGAVVASGSLAPGEHSITVPAGVYIARVGRTVKKVIVK